ncbi:MAG: GAF domain-containing protein, partial [Proteobacteria bacterium]|nr:GAF domain-containing protein [Pseudomonadota bacterium]
MSVANRLNLSIPVVNPFRIPMTNAFYDKDLVDYLKKNPALRKSELSEDDLKELAQAIHEDVVADNIRTVIDEAEHIITIDPSLTEKEILTAAVKDIAQFLQADAASIRIYDPVKHQMESYGSYRHEESIREHAVPYEDSIAGEAMKTEKSITIPNILKEPRYKNKDIMTRLGLNSMMAVPFHIHRFSMAERDIRGTIQVYYKESDRRFHEVDIRVAEMLARRVTFVIANKRILDLRRLNEQKERIVEIIFQRLGKREGIRMKDVFTLIIPELADIIWVQSCAFFSVSPDRMQVILEAGYPEKGGYHGVGKVFSVNDEPYFSAIIHQSAILGEYEDEKIYPSYILIDNPRRSRLLTEDLRRFAMTQNINSILYVPMKTRDVINYFLAFDALDKHTSFTGEEIELLVFFGKELMKAAKIEQLDDILHDFKNPAIATAGFAKRVKNVLEKGDFEKKREKVIRDLDIVLREASRMQEMAYSVYGAGKEEDVDMTEKLAHRLELNREAIRELKRRNIKIVKNLKTSLRVRCYPLHMERVFDNLLSNATQAIPEKGGHLVVTTYPMDQWAVAEISNTGTISEAEREQILDGETKGRGLHITNRLVKILGGRIELEGEDNHTTFR